MRVFVVVSCVVLGGCSWSGIDMPATYVPPVAAPDPAQAIEAAEKAVSELKLVGLVEMSAVRTAYPLGPAPYIMCVKGMPAGSDARRTYAVFLNGNVYVTSRSGVLIDECDSQSYTPLNRQKQRE